MILLIGGGRGRFPNHRVEAITIIQDIIIEPTEITTKGSLANFNRGRGGSNNSRNSTNQKAQKKAETGNTHKQSSGEQSKSLK